MSRCREFEDLIWEAAESRRIPDTLRPHLDACEHCRKQLESAREALAGLNTMRSVHAPDPTNAVRARLQAPRRVFPVFRPAFAAAALVLLIALAMLPVFIHRGTPSGGKPVVIAHQPSPAPEVSVPAPVPEVTVPAPTPVLRDEPVPEKISVVTEKPVGVTAQRRPIHRPGSVVSNPTTRRHTGVRTTASAPAPEPAEPGTPTMTVAVSMKTEDLDSTERRSERVMTLQVGDVSHTRVTSITESSIYDEDAILTVSRPPLEEVSRPSQAMIDDL